MRAAVASMHVLSSGTQHAVPRTRSAHACTPCTHVRNTGTDGSSMQPAAEIDTAKQLRTHGPRGAGGDRLLHSCRRRLLRACGRTCTMQAVEIVVPAHSHRRVDRLNSRDGDDGGKGGGAVRMGGVAATAHCVQGRAGAPRTS